MVGADLILLVVVGLGLIGVALLSAAIVAGNTYLALSVIGLAALGLVLLTRDWLRNRPVPGSYDVPVRARFDWLDWVLSGFALVAAAWIVFSSQFVKDTTGHLHWKWLAGQIIGAIAAAGLPMVTAWRARGREKTAEQREKEAIELTFLQVNRSLDPIVRSLAEGIARSRAGLKHQILDAVVGAAGDVIRPGRQLRACYLNAEPGPPRKLVLGEYQKGRVVMNPQTEIVEGTPLGNHVFEKFGKNESEFNANVDVHPPTGLTREEIAALGYKTFISVPVVAGGLGYGLLTVDGLKPGDLEDRDADVMRVLAGLVAIAMADEAARP